MSTEALRNAVNLVLALHDMGAQETSGVRLDPMAESQLRDALKEGDHAMKLLHLDQTELEVKVNELENDIETLKRSEYHSAIAVHKDKLIALDAGMLKKLDDLDERMTAAEEQIDIFKKLMTNLKNALA